MWPLLEIWCPAILLALCCGACSADGSPALSAVQAAALRYLHAEGPLCNHLLCWVSTLQPSCMLGGVGGTVQYFHMLGIRFAMISYARGPLCGNLACWASTSQ